MAKVWVVVVIACLFIGGAYYTRQQQQTAISQAVPHWVTNDPPAPGQWIHGLPDAPAIRPALPDDFTIVTIDPSGAWDMRHGVLWARPDTAARFENRKTESFDGIEDVLFYVRATTDIRQTGPDSFNIEANLAQSLAADGVTDIQTQKRNWSGYPVFAFTGKRPSGTTIHMACIGLNRTDGGTLLVDFRHPKKPDHPTPDALAIWERFLTESTITPTEPATDISPAPTPENAPGKPQAGE